MRASGPVTAVRALAALAALATFAAVAFVALLVACSDGRAAKMPAAAPPRVVVTEEPDRVIVAGPGVTVTIRREPVSVSFGAWGGPELAQESPGLELLRAGEAYPLLRVAAVEAGGEGARLAVGTGAGTATLDVSFPLDGAARISVAPPADAGIDRVRVTLASPAGEAIYGLSERTVSTISQSEWFPEEVGSLDRRGTSFDMEVKPSFSLYTPFFQTSRGYGVLVEGSAIGRYDLAESADAISWTFELPPGVPAHAFVFLSGPDHFRILDLYTALTGRPFLPPPWAFLHWRWRDEHRAGATAIVDGVELNADVADDLLAYERLGIPAGVYTIDRPWATGDLPDLEEPEEPGFGDLVFDPARFPDAAGMVEVLHARGYRAMLWIGPWATGVTTHAEAEAGGYLAPGSRFLLDLTNPAAVAWWEGKLQPLLALGFDGFKLDRGDEDTPDLATDVYADGRTGRELRNAYPLLFAQVHHDAVRRVRGDDFFNYPRAGWAGSQAFAIFSAGDVPGKDYAGRPTDLGLRNAILALSHNALNGFPIWGSDTGGYEQFGDRELFARWLEFSAFCPVMEIGGTGTHAPWDMPTEPSYDDELVEIYRRHVMLHHALAPYLHAHAVLASRSGRPVARPLLFDFRGDPQVRDLWDEFLLGDDILVAPVWRAGDRTRRVYLPEGTWVDAWEPARALEGPVWTDEPAPLGRIPVFVRAGADVLARFAP